MKRALRFLKALSDPTRLRILALLLKRELCVCELTFILKMEQSRISHQLRILKDADLVEDVREGRWIVYRIVKAKRKELKLILTEVLAREFSSERQFRKDLENLEVCFREKVRIKKTDALRPRKAG